MKEGARLVFSRKKQNVYWMKGWRTVTMVVMAVLFIAPLAFVFSNALMRPNEVMINYSSLSFIEEVPQNSAFHHPFINMKWVPEQIRFDAFYSVLIQHSQYMRWMMNSIVISVSIVAGSCAVATLSAYAFSKLPFKYKDALFFLYIMMMLMPYQVTLVSNYIVVEKMGLVGSQSGIILPGIFSAFGVFLLTQYMKSIPDEYLEAAEVEGANHIVKFSSIMLPLSKPGIIAMCLLSLIDQWNMIEQPMIFLNQASLYPMSVVLSQVNEQILSESFAASIVFVIPIVVVFMMWQKYLMVGVELSGMK